MMLIIDCTTGDIEQANRLPTQTDLVAVADGRIEIVMFEDGHFVRYVAEDKTWEEIQYEE